MNEVIYSGDMEFSPGPVGKVQVLGILTVGCSGTFRLHFRKPADSPRDAHPHGQACSHSGQMFTTDRYSPTFEQLPASPLAGFTVNESLSVLIPWCPPEIPQGPGLLMVSQKDPRLSSLEPPYDGCYLLKVDPLTSVWETAVMLQEEEPMQGSSSKSMWKQGPQTEIGALLLCFSSSGRRRSQNWQPHPTTRPCLKLPMSSGLTGGGSVAIPGSHYALPRPSGLPVTTTPDNGSVTQDNECWAWSHILLFFM